MDIINECAVPHGKMEVFETRVCMQCGIGFPFPLWRETYPGTGKYCSRRCSASAAHRLGFCRYPPKKDQVSGYRHVQIKSHPICPPSGRLPEHRLILYNKIGPGKHLCHWCNAEIYWSVGRRAVPGDIVADHLDGNRLNNDPGNIVPSCSICNLKRAQKNHIPEDKPYVIRGGGKRSAWHKICIQCGVNFLGSKVSARYCSHECHALHRKKKV